VPRDVASAATPRTVCDEGLGVGPSRGSRRLPGLRRRHQALGKKVIEERYGNLFEMYERITGETPTRCRCASTRDPLHDGRLWVDYNLMSTIPGLFVLGEANFSDHGANRLGASALMQGLADGYFVLPYTIGHYLASKQAREA
jgi:succinate dehydrogenase / fumarate reductase flavoprotein subunit